eukprot:10295515-Ditylum_brightwellii.AAC.2
MKKCIENAHQFKVDLSLIPRSAKFGFKLTAPKKLQDLPEFEIVLEEVDKALKKAQDFIHNSAVKVADFDIKRLKNIIQNVF